MKINAGSILVSAFSIDEPDFANAVIFIAEYNEKGAIGFVINKLFPRALNDLVEFKTAKAFPLHEGGPVENDHIYFIHERPDIIHGGTKINESVYLGGDFKQALFAINNGIIKENDIKLFVGYCGWDPGQIDQEMKEGAWRESIIDISILFSESIENIWDKCNSG
jgi:putative transcriptional regulator